MDTFLLLVRLLPAFSLVAYGTYAILEAFFPSLREPGFNYWDVETEGEYVQVLGWRKVLKPPRVIAEGYLSDFSACAVSISAGLVMVIIGFMIIRHTAGIPESMPDIIGRIFS